jgi:Zn-dependent peptidase ImmA (M78 family)
MERIQSINPERLAWCCADYDISPEELSAELGIALSSLNRALEGEDGVTFNQLRKIADYFGRGVLFFLEAGPIVEERVHSPQFRTLANQKPELSQTLKKLIERVEKQRDVYLALLEDLDEIDRQNFIPPELPDNNIPEAARIIRDWLGLGGLETVNDFNSYRKAVEAKGILVFRSNGYNGKWQIPKQSPILGFNLFDQNCPVIVIKKLPWESQQCFTLAHELGHVLLHMSSSIDDEQDLFSHKGLERDANAFAGHLLVPDNFLKTIRDIDRPLKVTQFDVWLEPQRRNWGVSTEVILRRLLDSGRLSQALYTEYRQWRAGLVLQIAVRGSRQYRYREPLHVFGDGFVRTVLGALNARHITLSKASGYLDSLKIKDLHQLENYYAGP